ncbi:MAG TPA: succinate dehydrogenase, partial [Polyangia bacterium]|nr:succinate dehydrogenase [Polyangia bacterium]
MATVDVSLKRVRFGHTARKDLWWVMPLVTFVVFTSFIIYTTWALLQGDNYAYGNYLSPFYEPEIFGNS